MSSNNYKGVSLKNPTLSHPNCLRQRRSPALVPNRTTRQDSFCNQEILLPPAHLRTGGLAHESYLSRKFCAGSMLLLTSDFRLE